MRNKTLISLTVLMTIFGTGTLALAQLQPSQKEAVKAEQSLSQVDAEATAASARIFRQVAANQGPSLTGMPTHAEMGRTALAPAVPVYMVRLDHLQQYQTGADPAPLLQDLHTVIYPVVVGDEVRSEMVLSKVEGTWIATSFGGTDHARVLEKVRRGVIHTAQVAADATFLVRVPALNVEFVGYQGAQGLLLTPLLDRTAADLKAGQSLPAVTVFERLAPLARQHNGLPS
jgi:hypothetical protein